MKRLVCLLLLTAVCHTTMASRYKSVIQVWPTDMSKISRNPVFLISCYDTDSELIKNLNIKYNVYLQSERTIIPLKVIKRKKLLGDRYFTMAILKPVKFLSRGETYKLVIANLSSFKPYWTDYESCRWTAGRLIDHEKPVWTTAPGYLGNEVFRYGQTADLTALFNTCKKDRSPVVLFIRQRYLESGDVSESIVTSADNTVILTGESFAPYPPPLPPQPPAEYLMPPFKGKCEVSFLLMDASGNFSEGWTKPIVFDGQFPEGKSEVQPCKCPEVKYETEEGEITLISFSSVLLLGLISFVCVPVFLDKKRSGVFVGNFKNIKSELRV